MISKTFAAYLFMPLLVIAGCGGGSNSPMPQQNLQSARAPPQPMTIPATMLSATDTSGNSWSATYSETAGGMAMFNGQNATTSAIALTISENGVLVASDNSTAYYLTNPYSPLGNSGSTSGVAWTALITSYTPLPSTLTVGGSGPFMTATYYDAANNVIGSLTETYTVTANSPTALFLNIDAAGSINGVQETLAVTCSIASDGTLLAVTQVQVTVNGTTLTFH